MGMVIAIPTIDERRRARSRRAYTCHAIATRNDAVAERATRSSPSTGSRKSRCRSGREQVQPAEPARAVEAVVAMLHRPRGACSAESSHAVQVAHQVDRAHRVGEQEALAELAAQRRAACEACVGALDALGDHLEVEASRRAATIAAASAGRPRRPSVRNERSILRMSTGKPAEVAERRVAGAEVVHRELDAERLQRVQPLDARGPCRPSSRDSVISSTSALGVEAGGRERVARRRRRSSSDCSCLTDRLTLIVSGAVGRRTRSAAGAAWRQASFEHPAPDRDDQAGLLGERDELRRRDRAARRVLPAQQRLDAVHARCRRAGSRAGSAPRAGRCSSARCRSARISSRSTTSRCIVGLEDAVAPLRSRLAMYMATSALRSRSAASVEAAAGQAQPMLAPTKSSLLAHVDRRVQRLEDRARRRRRPPASAATSSTSTANSSPPKRATVSVGRTALAQARARPPAARRRRRRGRGCR